MKDNISTETYGLITGIMILIGLPILGYMFGGWKWAFFWFLIPQLILMIIKVINRQK